MKKTILNLFFLALVVSGFSQSEVGFKFGYLIPNYKITSTPSNSTENFTIQNGLNYSINYKRRWPGLFNFGAEIEYHQIQSHFNLNYKSLGADVISEMDFSTNNLIVRLLPEFVYGQKLRAYFQIGPYMGFLLSSHAKGESVITDGTNQAKIFRDDSADDFFPGIDWGIFFGGGLEYPLSKQIKLALELQYTRGFAGYSQSDEYVLATQNFTMGLSFIYVFKGYASRLENREKP